MTRLGVREIVAPVRHAPGREKLALVLAAEGVDRVDDLCGGAREASDDQKLWTLPSRSMSLTLARSKARPEL